MRTGKKETRHMPGYHSKLARTKMRRLETCDLIPASSSRIWKHPVQLKTCKLKICSNQKGHCNQKGGRPDTLDPPLSTTALFGLQRENSNSDCPDTLKHESRRQHYSRVESESNDEK